MPSRYLWAVFVSLLLGGMGVGQDVTSPIADTYLLPLGRPASPGLKGCAWHLGVSLANQLSYAHGPWGEMGFDLEEIRVTPGLSWNQGPWSLGFYWPFSLYYGGVLDYLLDPLHQALGLPKNEVQGQVLLFARRGDTERRWEGPVFGPRDAHIRMDLSLGGGGLYAALALPLGGVAQFMGSGGYRVLTGVAWGWSGGEARLGAVWPLGPQPGLEPFPYGPAWMGLVRLRPWEGPLGLEVLGFLGPLRDAGPYSLGVALRVSYGNWAFAEDGTRGMPDVVLSWRHGGGCPHFP
ncbi:hypothetical protein [Thermus albus]|uniref:hypothetical protein n=1 Tax=Thermus albus TaxID=2908146 RepID=UPI001FAA0111|nr:hypothetical protein [Thermus albus]